MLLLLFNHTNRSERRQLCWFLLLLSTILPTIESYSDVCQTQECDDIAFRFQFTMNTSVNPCDDFYEFACGGNTHQFDAHSQLVMETAKKYHEALILKQKSSSRSMRLAANFYEKCLNQDEQTDTSALLNLGDQLHEDFIQSDRSFEELMRFATLEGRDTIFRIGFQSGSKYRPPTYSIRALAPKTSKNIEEELEAYDVEVASHQRDFAAKLMKLSEEAFVVQSMTVEELNNRTPYVNWRILLGSGVPLNKTILVEAPQSWLADLNTLVAATNKRVLKLFVGRRFYYAYSELVTARAAHVNDVPVQREICSRLVAIVLPRAALAIFAERHLPPSSIRAALSLVDEIRKSLTDLYSRNDVLEIENTSRDKAIETINSVQTLLGYMKGAVATMDSDAAWMKVADICETLSFIELFRMIQQTKQLKAIKQVEDHITEDILDLGGQLKISNVLSLHTIVLPANYLLSPVFEPNGPLFYLYGLMGSIIGHEILHSLIYEDDIKSGIPKDPTSKDDHHPFLEHAECFVEHYDNYTVQQGTFRVNGSLTLQENMADHGGVDASFKAFMASIQMNGRDLPLPGLNYTSEQLFFLSYAQFYCPRVPFDPADAHAPFKVRVLGVASNSLEFSKAFNCPIGSPMNPIKKCNVWPTTSNSRSSTSSPTTVYSRSSRTSHTRSSSRFSSDTNVKYPSASVSNKFNFLGLCIYVIVISFLWW